MFWLIGAFSGKMCAAFDPSGALIVCGGGQRFWRPNNNCWQLIKVCTKPFQVSFWGWQLIKVRTKPIQGPLPLELHSMATDHSKHTKTYQAFWGPPPELDSLDRDSNSGLISQGFHSNWTEIPNIYPVHGAATAFYRSDCHHSWWFFYDGNGYAKDG